MSGNCGDDRSNDCQFIRGCRSGSFNGFFDRFDGLGIFLRFLFCAFCLLCREGFLRKDGTHDLKRNKNDTQNRENDDHAKQQRGTAKR